MYSIISTSTSWWYRCWKISDKPIFKSGRFNTSTIKQLIKFALTIKMGELVIECILFDAYVVKSSLFDFWNMKVPINIVGILLYYTMNHLIKLTLLNKNFVEMDKSKVHVFLTFDNKFFSINYEKSMYLFLFAIDIWNVSIKRII